LRSIRNFATLLLIALSFLEAVAQTTGKISGKVYDAETMAGLPGANVIVVNSFYGAACDAEGDFFIINMPPGNYELRVSMIGYTQSIVKNVEVSVNRTTHIDVPMSLSAIEMNEVVVEAERISIEKDQTASIRNISAGQMELLPVENIDQVVSMQAGIVKGHFRGGRSSEVSYLLDGIQITEPFDNSGKVVNVEKEAIQDLEVITGTFNAEYGRAMSGVINAVTKDGGNQFHGSASIGYGNYYTTHDDIFIGLKPSEYDRNRDYKVNLSGPIIPDRLTFLINARLQNNKNHLNGIRRFEPDNYSDFSSETPSDWISEHTGDNKYASLNYNLSQSFMAKLSSALTKKTHLSLMYHNNGDEWQNYSHTWKYNPDGKAISHSKSDFIALQLNNIFSQSAFFDLKLSYLNNFDGWYVAKDPLSPVYVHDAYLSNAGTWFYTGGQEKGHSKRWSENRSVKWDLTWQINKKHMIKTGFLYVNYRLENRWYEIQNAYDMRSEPEESYYIDPETGHRVYPYYEPFIFTDTTSIYSDEYVVKPYEFSAYIQDKLEHKEIVLNYGLRLDYFDPNTVYPSQLRNPSNQLSFPDYPERMSRYPEASPKYQISPRLGLAYQLGNTAVLHFSYGHFLQMPPMYALYQNRKFVVAPQDYYTTMGNPQLKAQKTVQYEAGVWQELADNLNLEVAVYYKDIFELLSTKIITTYNQIQYGLYSNKDYGNVKGLEIKLDYMSGSLSAFLNYTLQYSRGNADNPTQNFTRAGDALDPITNLIPMSWDQRHTLNATVAYNIKNLSMSLTGYYDSGTPFNWQPLSTSRLADQNFLPNNEYMPASFSVDMNASYSWRVFKGIGAKLIFQTYNLLDQLNDSWVDSQTGRAYTAIVRESDLSSFHSDFTNYYDTIHDPSMYTPPRFVKISLELNF